MIRTILLTVYISSSVAAFAADLTVSKPEDVGMSTERLKRLSAFLQSRIDQGELAGTVTLIARRGKVVHYEAQGMMNIEKKIPMRTDAIFRLQSMTKPIASVAVMMLLEEGRFLLNDPVSKFIPEFKNPKVAVIVPTPLTVVGRRLVPAEREITIHDLLTHTAGLPVAAGYLVRQEYAELERGRTIEEPNCSFVRRLAKVPLHFQPGAVWEYGPATNVLACYVEAVSGQRFDQFLSDRIFQPLELKDTFYYVPDEKLDRLATLYGPSESTGLSARTKDISGYPEGEGRGSRFRFGGNAGLLSTAEDYLKFCEMLLNGGSFGGRQLLSPKTIQTMTTNHVEDKPMHGNNRAGYRFGLGFRVLADPSLANRLSSPGEYGWGGANGTYFWVDPKEEMIGIFMTQTVSLIEAIQGTVQTLAMQAIID